ncbi:MAG TPA: phosphoglucosamine mutase [Chitinivibrionales bacterium]|nr:phosphoglucosamine mutase [Chitinivibrionales bacterium]
MPSLPIMSVSGIRGIIGETLTPHLVYTIARIQTRLAGGGDVVVSRDTRPTGPMLAAAIYDGIAAGGGIAVDIGIAPTPTACVAVDHFRASSGVMITASHNPLPYNGYKMVHAGGRLFTGKECDEVYRAFALQGADAAITAPGTLPQKKDAIRPHLERILGAIDTKAIRKARITVAVDSINGAAGAMFPQLLERLGVDWVGVHNKLDGDFAHNPEPRPEHLQDLSRLLASTNGLWCGFAFDPDADRLALMGEAGQPLTEELTLVLALENVLSKKKSDVATNLSTSMMVDDVAREFGVRVFRTKIGEANVVEAMAANGCAIGGEGNGGVIYPAVSTVRDGLTAMALILELMAKRKKPVTALAARWPSYSIVKEKIPCGSNPGDVIAALAGRFANETIDTQDGLKIIRSNGWVHVRPSNTEPIVRCIAEAPTEQQARALARMMMEKIPR